MNIELVTVISGDFVVYSLSNTVNPYHIAVPKVMVNSTNKETIESEVKDRLISINLRNVKSLDIKTVDDESAQEIIDRIVSIRDKVKS